MMFFDIAIKLINFTIIDRIFPQNIAFVIFLVLFIYSETSPNGHLQIAYEKVFLFSAINVFKL